MKKTITITAVFLFAVSGLFAQYTLDWQRNANLDQKKSVMSAVDSSDNIVVTGYIQSYRTFTKKYDLSGTLLWEVEDSSGIPSIYEKPNWVSCDANNNIFVVGNLYSISSFYDYPNSIVAIKYSPSGTLLWRTVIPISILINSQISFDCRSVVDANGNLYIGTAINNGATLFKLDTNGNIIFTNSSAINAPINFNGMRIRNDKIAVATSSGTTNVSPVFVWDTTGTLLWTANAIGTHSADVEIDEQENVYVLSSLYHLVNSITWDYDVKLTKFNASGNLLWNHTYDFGGYNFATRMTYVNNRISGISYGNASGIKWQTFQTDTSGNLLWASPYSEPAPLTVSDSYPHYVTATPNAEVLVTGVGGPTPDPQNPSYNQMPIVQYSNTGVQNWLSTPNIYAGTGLATMFASDGSLYAIGSRNLYVFHYNSTQTAIAENIKSANSIKIYPNPFTSNIHLVFNEENSNNNCILSITDVLGRVVKTCKLNNIHDGNNDHTIDLSELQKGIYFCTKNSTDSKTSVKIIKN